MLAVLAPAPYDDERLAYEPKYDGIRALAAVEPGQVRFWSRLGNEKTSQFPEVARALEQLARRWRRPVVLDGEIVAVDAAREPVGFQHLQGRMHLVRPADVDRAAAVQPAAYMVFDLLRDGADDLRPLAFRERRRRLEQLLARTRENAVRITDVAFGDAGELLRQAAEHDWEGLIAKDAASGYETGKRSPAWRKLKTVRRQEFVVGGWTEPRQTRQHFGALLLGVYAARGTRHAAPGTPHPARSTRHTARHRQTLIYVGSVGTGFTEAELARVSHLLRARGTSACPFEAPPVSVGRAHWVRPDLVAEVKFAEWTADDKLRAPVYLGLRDDVRPETVRREPVATSGAAPAPSGRRPKGHPPARRESSFSRPANRTATASGLDRLIARLDELEDSRRDGVLELPGGATLKVTNLRKTFWPELGATKGDLLRHYVRVAPFILPAVEDRPLVMKRFPNGIHGKAFYQQRAPDDVPEGVRTQDLVEDGERMPRLVGGSLLTLLYMAQLAAISQDPWFSRAQSPEHADYVALDLDPQPGVEFAQVLDVARWIGEVLDRLGTPSVPKTSGSRGLHIYIPLPPATSYESGMLFCQIVATVVASKHPAAATVERTVAARGRTVYIDYLQNIRGKTLATAYSPRANAFGGVSTPLTWDEVRQDIDPREFTIATVADRLRQVGDLWAALRTARPADLRAAFRLAAR